jgi:hypothetical protein
MSRMMDSIEFVLSNMRQSATPEQLALIQSLKDNAEYLLKAERSHIVKAAEHYLERIEKDKETEEMWRVRLTGIEYLRVTYIL